MAKDEAPTSWPADKVERRKVSEEWRALPGFPDVVSSFGAVRRVTSGKGAKAGRIVEALQ